MFMRAAVLSVVLFPAVVCSAAKGSEAQPEEGFVPLISGDSLEGWQGALDGYELKDGVLASKEESGGFLCTKREYADFIFRFEFRLSPGGNNGIAIRAPLDGLGSTSRTGM